MIPKMDRYVVGEWAIVFALALLATVGLLLLEDMQDNLEDLVGFGASAGQVGRYYLALVPSFLPTVLPLALLLSVLFSLGRLHRGGEITAMRATGQSFLRITRGLWLMGLLCAGLLWYLSGVLVPWSVERSRTLWENLAFAQELEEKGEAGEVGIVPALTFYNHAEGRLWYMNRFSEYAFRAFGVTVHELDGDGREVERLSAGEAYFDDGAGEWVFLDGRRTRFDPQSGTAVFSRAFEEERFPGLTEHPDIMRYLKKEPDKLSFFELASVLKALPEGEDPRAGRYAVRYHRTFTLPLSCLLVIGIAVPYAVRGVRTNPAVATSQSVSLFFTYYLLANIFSLLGERALLPPLLAAWAPTAVMAAVAVYLWRTLR